MDYVLGSVAALITGNVTPSRPKLMKRALTPTKHQPSPNVTPKSEFVEDRSIFLSPSMQKKKAMVKKSPKRIFQNPELENTENGEGNLSLTSPKGDKVKKHLKDDLEADNVTNKSISSQKSPKNKGNNNKREAILTQESNKSVTEQDDSENTPKKKKQKQNLESDNTENLSTQPTGNVSTENTSSAAKRPKKKKQRRKSVGATDSVKENDTSEKSNAPTPNKSPKKQDNKSNTSETAVKSNEESEASNNNTPKKKNKRRKKRPKSQVAPATTENKDEESVGTDKENIQKENQVATKKKNKKHKKSKGPQNKPEIMDTDEQKPDSESESDSDDDEEEEDTEPKSTVNPNAITDKESDSEHESDDEIESENEEINKKVLESEKPESSDEEDEDTEKVEKKEGEKKEGGKKEDGEERITEEEIKRTLFVGNVPFSVKCKKELKKIFGQHGQIETIRIRTVPIKDGRYTPKLAVIKNELHPERTTVNVYIKYADEDSVEKALVENNTILNENHLRVSRSSSTGAEHDPKCSVFIGNLPFAMEDEALRAKFENCGEIHSVRIIRDKKTNAGKGFGYVNFESKDGVELALALTEEDLTVKNRILRVKRCTQTTTKKKPVKNNNNVKHSGYKGGNHQPNQETGGFNNQSYQQRGGEGGFRSGSQQRGGFRSGSQQRGGFRGGSQQRGGFRGGNQRSGGFRGDNEVNQQGGGFRGGNNQQSGGFRGGNNQGYQQRSGPPSRNNQGNRQRAFGAGNNQQRGGFNNKFDSQRNLPQKDEQGREGAHRRVMNKRKNQDGAGGDAPLNKKPKDMDQPKEKKTRKEFVGMTAEKKKKHKFDKGLKKKKALSEILTK